ncbi:MAG: O-methyltransferase [Bacteroidetes bacterium]|nr:O-methyltransferase [Bacteroidota bacterium]
MDFLPHPINEYVEKYTQPPGEVLVELERETYQKVLMPQMVSGHVQGQMLRTFSFMIQPKRILEIGTFTGYSALCLAAGLVAGGKLITIDVNAELEEMVRRYIWKAGMESKIDFHIGNAVEIIPTLNEVFDLVFIDADKINYSNYFDLVWPKLRPGGFIIADNVLWSGKVLEAATDKDTQALKDYAEKVRNHPNAEHVLFPVRDGLMVVRKV